MEMTRDRLRLSYLDRAAKGDVSLQYILAASDLFADKLELQQENAQLRERIVAQEPKPEGKPGKPVLAQVPTDELTKAVEEGLQNAESRRRSLK